MVRLLPHKTCDIAWQDKECSSFRLALPWMQIEVDVDPVDRPWVRKAIDDLSNRHFDTKAAQRFLDFFQEHPVSFTAPDAAKLNNPKYPVEDTFLMPFHKHTDRPAEFIDIALGCFTSEDFLPGYWLWDHDEILQLTRIENSDLHDPTSLITFLVGQRLATEAASEHDRVALPQKLDLLRKRNEDHFFKVSATIIRQTYYVASNFLHCITPTLKTFPQGKKAVQHFIDEELGHDKLMLKSLKKLNCQAPSSIHVFEPFTLMMRLFSYAAHFSPLALTWYIGMLEGSSYTETDLIADVIKQSSNPDAAFAYEKHHEINLEHDHKNIIYEIADTLPLLHRPSALFAIQICETASHLSVAIDRCLHHLVESAIAAET